MQKPCSMRALGSSLLQAAAWVLRDMHREPLKASLLQAAGAWVERHALGAGAGAALMQPVAAAGAVEEGTDGDDGSDPLFDAGETLVNSSGARVVFTTAAASKLEPTAAKGAAVHVWETT